MLITYQEYYRIYLYLENALDRILSILRKRG